MTVMLYRLKLNIAKISKDCSRSICPGQTLYIEPSSIVEMNNQISRLRNDEAVERERILTELTGMVAAEADGCLIAESVMGQIDFNS